MNLGLSLSLTSAALRQGGGVPFNAWRYENLKPVRKDDGGYWKKDAA